MEQNRLVDIFLCFIRQGLFKILYNKTLFNIFNDIYTETWYKNINKTARSVRQTFTYTDFFSGYLFLLSYPLFVQLFLLHFLVNLIPLIVTYFTLHFCERQSNMMTSHLYDRRLNFNHCMYNVLLIISYSCFIIIYSSIFKEIKEFKKMLQVWCWNSLLQPSKSPEL